MPTDFCRWQPTHLSRFRLFALATVLTSRQQVFEQTMVTKFPKQNPAISLRGDIERERLHVTKADGLLQ